MPSEITRRDAVGFGFACGSSGSIILSRLLVAFCFIVHLAVVRAGDYNYSSTGGEITITAYTGNGGAVSIPSTIDGLPVTRIGDLAFYCLTNVTSVEIPSGIVSIGQTAFAACGNLTSATLPSTVNAIGDGAFQSNAKLASVNLPGGLLSLGNEVFSSCPALTTITIPASVVSMGTGTFKSCQGLTSVTVLANVANIGINTFEGCSGLTNVTLPAGLTTLPDYLFSGCSKLTSVTIPAGVTRIGNGAFDGCHLLPAITIPAGVTSIGNYAFRSCRSLADLTLLGGVQTIGYYAFAGCWKLTSASFPAGLTGIGDYAFSYCPALASVTLPAGLTRIDSYAFISCSSLAGVTIPASVTSIGFSVFAGCKSSQYFTVEEANPNYRSLDGVLYDKSVTRLMAYPGDRAGSFIVPDGVLSIDSKAFSGCANLTGISMPPSLTTIGDGAFSSCPLLENITIPPSVTWIDTFAFSYCGKLGAVLFSGNAPSTGWGIFDSAAAGFTVFYQQGATGFSSPLWKGYPAVVVSASQEISVKGPLGESLADGSAALDFGYLLPGASRSKILTIANTGAVPLTGISVSVVGSAADFTVGNPAAAVLAPGTSTTFTVTFTAGTSGFRNAALHVLSDDADESPFDIQLSGICTPTPFPEITVSQTANGPSFEDGVSVLDTGTSEVGPFVVTGITIRNSGTGDMHGLAITLDGGNAEDFSFSSTPPAVLSPGSSFSCIVSFSPKALGVRTAQLHIASDDADENPFDIPLIGIGKAPPSPEIAVEPSTGPGLTDGASVITFEPVQPGSQSVTQTFTIRNQGDAYLQNISIVKDGANASDFVIGTLSKNFLPGGQSMTFFVRFGPLSAGAKVAALHIFSNDADESPFDIQLSGSTPGATPEIGVRTSDGTTLADGTAAISIGSVELDDSETRVFTITNSGSAVLSNIAFSFDGEHAADFTVTGPASKTISPGGQADFTVHFTPGALGDRSARLHIASNDSDENPFDIDLSGTGISPTFPEIAVESPSGEDLEDAVSKVSLGTPALHSSVSSNFTIRNTGNADLMNLSVTVDGPNSTLFTIPPSIPNVPQGESTTFTVIFNASIVGKVNATLHILSNDADEIPFDIPLSATVVAPPALPEIDVRQLTGKSLKDGSSECSFGSVKTKSSSSRVFMIRNLGKMNLKITSVTSNGLHAKDFVVKPPAGTVLKPGASMKFKVIFSPSAKGLLKASIHIKSSDANEASFDFDLIGKGLSASASASGFAGSVSRISATKAGGPRYLTLTVLKPSGTALEDPLVEVSSNLVDWYSGSRHTTVVHDGPKKLVVRDNTPDRPDARRYIRLKPSPVGHAPTFPLFKTED